jgi:hypothetical protein
LIVVRLEQLLKAFAATLFGLPLKVIIVRLVQPAKAKPFTLVIPLGKSVMARL